MREQAAEAAATADDQRERARRTGEILRQARIGHGQTLSDVEHDIRINRLYLEALEAGRFEVLPAPVYARGFMRSYARYLGLDPEEAAHAVPRDLPRPAGLEPLPGLRRSPPIAMPALSGPVIAAAVGVVLLLAVVYFAVPRLAGGAGVDGASVSTATSAVAPNLIGIPRDASAAIVTSAGLKANFAEAASDAPAGQVFRQTPSPGTPTKRGDTINLFISLGPEGGAAKP